MLTDTHAAAAPVNSTSSLTSSSSPAPALPHERAGRLWQAVLSRDRRADGLFVYAVRSTGVYCRPSCPSRRPSRDRVQFFPSPVMAESGGYRACLRCRPKEPIAPAPALERIRQVCAAIAGAPERRWTSAAISRAGGGSAAQVQRAFRAVLGMSPRDYAAACRRRRFLTGLREQHDVTRAIYDAGYGSSSRAYTAFRLPGMTPATYGRRGKGARIHWLTTRAPIGRILVAATDTGLCFVEVDADGQDEVLRDALAREFPEAAIDAAPSPRLRRFAEAARAVADTGTAAADLPVDVRGTAFQWRVWRALTTVRRGETRTYLEVAREIGRPSASRAVARACATNPLALVVPCHRVVRADGGPSGYRWGGSVKRALLARERRR